MDSPTEDMTARIEAELRPGESLVWTGRANGANAARRASPAAYFGVVWTLFSLGLAAVIFFGADPPEPGAAVCGSICMSLFTLIGPLLVSVPFWSRRRARRTAYALTNRRALIWSPACGGTEVRFLDLSHLRIVARRDFIDGIGDLVFEDTVTVHRDSEGVSAQKTEWGFLDIDKVREVEELVQRVKSQDQG
jgi:hypothetical protein